MIGRIKGLVLSRKVSNDCAEPLGMLRELPHPKGRGFQLHWQQRKLR